MAQLTGASQIFEGDTSIVDTTARHALGTRAFDKDGNEYIYALGVASTVAGSWVTFDETYTTLLAVANGVGRIGVAMAAIVASSYGWYQIYGYNAAAKAITGGGCAADKAIYLTSTPGSCDDVKVVGDGIHSAISRVAESASSGVIGVELNHPYSDDYNPVS